MRAACENNHPQEEMYIDQMQKLFVCPVCGQKLDTLAILAKTPEQYRSGTSMVVNTLQLMADYEIMGIVESNRKFRIEYPRRNERSR